MNELRPNSQRAKNAIMLIWIVFTLEIISLISSYFQYELFQNIANGIEISTEEVDTNDIRELIISILYMIAMTISIVTFIKWFRRAYFNLHLKVNHLTHSEGWAAGSWFVPIVSLYRPYQIMKELYEETKKLLLKNGINSTQKYKKNILGWWWTIWIISSFVGQFVFRYSMRAESIDELTINTIAYMVSNIIDILLALFTIKVIKDYSNLETLLKKIPNNNEQSTTV